MSKGAKQFGLFSSGDLKKSLSKPISVDYSLSDPFAPRPIRNGDLMIIYGNVPSKSNCYRIITFKPKKDAPNKIVECESCNGNGLVEIEGASVKCGFCDGSGEVEKEPHSHASLAKTGDLKSYEKSFLAQLALFQKSDGLEMITGEFALVMDVYYPSMRPDLDNSLKIVLDCLQTGEAIKNDNKCVELRCRKKIDKINPRIEFKVVPF